MRVIFVKIEKRLKGWRDPSVWEDCHMVGHVGTLTETGHETTKKVEKYQIW